MTLELQSPPPPTRPPRRRRLRTTEDGRRTSTAGHALVVAVLALLFACLLNAPHMHKTAYNLPAGWQRDVALAISGPVADVSHALLLDRPRKAVQWAAGRSGEDRIDTVVAVLPPPPDRPAVTHAKPGRQGARTSSPPPRTKPRKQAFSPRRKLRIWIAGDSLVITPGWAIARAAGRARAIQTVGDGPEGRVATGLERPDVFNWFQEIARRVRELKPHVVVLDFGGNDDHGYMTGLPQGRSIGEFGSASWRAEYARRVGGVMDIANRGGAFVVWIGLPITRSDAQTNRFDVVNGIVEQEARKRPGHVAFIDTYTTFASESGGFAQYLTDASGKKVLVRAPDGVHFERAGGDMIARMVLHVLNQQFDLTSWRRHKP
jgi:hypothetical protein